MYSLYYTTTSFNPSDWTLSEHQLFIADFDNAKYLANLLAECKDIHSLYIMDSLTGEIMFDITEDECRGV